MRALAPLAALPRHPLPGWIDSKAALAGVAFMMGGGIMRTIAARPGSPLDIVPVDFVAHSLLRAAAGAGVALPDGGGGGGGGRTPRNTPVDRMVRAQMSQPRR